MRISDYLFEESVILELTATTKKGAIEEICNRLAAGNKIQNKDKFMEDVLEREDLGSTGIGNGIAIPHSRTDAVNGFVIGFGKSQKGLEFQAIDGEKVNLIFLMGADPKNLSLYLRLLAELSKLLMSHPFRSALMRTQTTKEIIQVVKDFETNH